MTIYLPTSTVPAHSELNQQRARGLVSQAIAQVGERTDHRTAALIEEHLTALLEDPSFWFDVGRSLAVFVTADGAVEFRLPNELTEYVGVADRFVVTPLLRAVTFPQAAFVLALSQNGARLIEVSADLPAQEIQVSDLPESAQSAAGLASIGGRSPYGRLQGMRAARCV